MCARRLIPCEAVFHHGHPSYIPALFHYEAHSHCHHEMILVQQGRLRARVGGSDCVAGRGDILLYTAGTLHEEWTEDCPVLVWTCSFDWSGLGPNERLLRHDAHGRVQELLARMNFLKQIGKRHLCPLVVQVMLVEFKRLATLESNAMVEQVRAFIRSNLDSPFSLDDLAQAAGLSKCHFVRQYRTITGRTPMEDARILRVEEARHLLINSTLLLREIAPKVGLRDEYQLSRLLKIHLGMGARELRLLRL